MLKIGGFYTTCSSGFWQLIDLKDKIAGEDYHGECVSWKKGDHLGQWAIMKKAFTPKMKPRIDYEYIDSTWLKPVTMQEDAAIFQAFSDDAKYSEKFASSQIKLRPTVASCFQGLPEEREEEMRNLLSVLPERFTLEQLWEICRDFKQYYSYDSAKYILYCMYLPWDMNTDCEYIYSAWELRRVTD